MIKPKLYRCKQCDKRFERTYTSTQRVCGPKCAIAEAKDKQAVKKARTHRDRKKRLRDNDRSTQIKSAQATFNRYVRLRDNDLPCISCDRFHSGQYHAGHYRTVGANPELRFDERNCHKQCSACNNHLSGNIVNYRINLIRRLGAGVVEQIEGPHAPRRYSIDNLKTIQRWYKRRIKRLESKQ